MGATLDSMQMQLNQMQVRFRQLQMKHMTKQGQDPSNDLGFVGSSTSEERLAHLTRECHALVDQISAMNGLLAGGGAGVTESFTAMDLKAPGGTDAKDNQIENACFSDFSDVCENGY